MSQLNLDVDMEEKKVTRQIDIPFSVSEFAQMGVDAGSLAKQRDEHKAAAKECQTDLDAVLKKIEHGKKSENVTCTMKLFYSTRTVQVFHEDEMIEERAMVEAEFQQEFRGVNGDEEDDHAGELTAEEAREDLQQVIRDEQDPTKAVAT